MYRAVLRGRPWWRIGGGLSPDHSALMRPTIKLQGDATGHVDQNPIVLSTRSYRGRIHSIPHYATFLKTVFATKTVLYLGFLFSDHDINEVRSEVLAMTRAGPIEAVGASVHSLRRCRIFPAHPRAGPIGARPARVARAFMRDAVASRVGVYADFFRREPRVLMLGLTESSQPSGASQAESLGSESDLILSQLDHVVMAVVGRAALHGVGDVLGDVVRCRS